MDNTMRITIAVGAVVLFGGIGIASAMMQYPWLVFACIIVGGICLVGAIAPSKK